MKKLIIVLFVVSLASTLVLGSESSEKLQPTFRVGIGTSQMHSYYFSWVDLVDNMSQIGELYIPIEKYDNLSFMLGGMFFKASNNWYEVSPFGGVEYLKTTLDYFSVYAGLNVKKPYFTSKNMSAGLELGVAAGLASIALGSDSSSGDLEEAYDEYSTATSGTGLFYFGPYFSIKKIGIAPQAYYSAAANKVDNKVFVSQIGARILIGNLP